MGKGKNSVIFHLFQEIPRPSDLSLTHPTLYVTTSILSRAAVSNFFDTGDWFHGRQFSHGPGGRDGYGTIQTHCIFVHFISVVITSAPPQSIRH